MLHNPMQSLYMYNLASSPCYCFILQYIFSHLTYSWPQDSSSSLDPSILNFKHSRPSLIVIPRTEMMSAKNLYKNGKNFTTLLWEKENQFKLKTFNNVSKFLEFQLQAVVTSKHILRVKFNWLKGRRRGWLLKVLLMWFTECQPSPNPNHEDTRSTPLRV